MFSSLSCYWCRSFTDSAPALTRSSGNPSVPRSVSCCGASRSGSLTGGSRVITTVRSNGCGGRPRGYGRIFRSGAWELTQDQAVDA